MPPRREEPEDRVALIDLGNAIRFLRGRRSQLSVAALAGVEASNWSLYETGKRRASEGTIQRICHALGCTRLELEETLWRFRRVRLAALAPEVPLDSPPLPEPRQRELEQIVPQLVAVLTDLLLWLDRGRRP